MRKLGLIALVLAYAASLFAAPARRGWTMRTLADGTSVEVQQVGDEFDHYLVTRDGKMIANAPRARRAPQSIGTPTPHPRVLVILVSYSDIAINAKNTSMAIDSMMNYPGYSYNHATGSVRDYFIAQSDSQYTPVFDVVGPVTLANNRKYYGENNSQGNDRRAGDMIKDACKAVDDIVDFSKYDSDGNGTVDAVYVIYAGIGANDVDGVADAIWPHQSVVSGLTLDGKSISTYACSGEIDGYTKERCGIGPICHEYGHAIGMPDYYGTGSTSDYILGEWSVMDYGMYNNDANTPPNYSIFDKQYMGWATVKELKADEQKNITLTTDYASGYKLTDGTTTTTYYIENRQRTGWDIALPGSGMLLWQVKYNQSAWNANHVNYTAGSPRYSVISATCGLMTDGNVTWSTAADPFPGSQNVTSWTQVSGYAITNITQIDGKILCKLNGGKTECTYEILPEHCVVPDDGVLAIGNTLTLTISPEEGYMLDDAECWAVEMGNENPLLEYGVDFTYDALTNEFRIENVTDDVVIIVEAKEDQGTGLENTQQSAISVRKILRNGQLIIVRGGKQFNAQGVEIQ